MISSETLFFHAVCKAIVFVVNHINDVQFKIQHEVRKPELLDKTALTLIVCISHIMLCSMNC